MDAVARFCSGCGAPLLAADPCTACATRPDRAATVAEHLRPIRAALALYFSLLVFCIALLALSALVPGRTVSTEAFEIVSSVGISLIVLTACLASWRDLLPVLRCTGPARWYALAPLLSLATFGFAWAVCHGAWKFLGVRPHDGPLLPAFPWWAALLLISLQPGIFEELAFRGLIQTWLARTLGRRETLGATALLFATIHLNAVMFVHVSIMGLVLGLVRQRSGSLYPGMLLHACHNTLVLVTAALPGWTS